MSRTIASSVSKSTLVSSSGGSSSTPIEFPIIRKECLGDGKFIKMRRYTLGAECKLCGKVYTSFSWKKHPKDVNYQRTVICPVCAITKNLCQVTVVDLDYDIPAYVRDSQYSLTDHQASVEGNTASAFSGQKSSVTNVYFASQAEKLLSEGGTNRHLLRNELANRNVLNELRDEEGLDDTASNSTVVTTLNGNLGLTSAASLEESMETTSPPIDLKTIQIGSVNRNVVETSDDYIDEKTLLEFVSIYATTGQNTKGVGTVDLRDLIEKCRHVPSHHCYLITFVHQGDAELCMQKLGKKNGGKFKLNGQTLTIKWARKKKRFEPYEPISLQKSSTTQPLSLAIIGVNDEQ
ncbi:hypothetical protein FDP41_007715 [Naegleria fowleri]|uniref:STL11/RBM22-like N-terminal domain-containing protein n=1 Tax=Naegleria fowleri TaxID=5763 RepID=A0A6A5CE02_NAEFO|nr:uncharacterized protein FDP41_007715 [Naegleria fowleri]KAF0983800.1 hypothetical protein FDP41_007715 [Naegleria fowleri]CAG4713206.1 unnamed protein product [Naegleria fowleri]